MEQLKRDSRHLRGDIERDLADPLSGAISDASTKLLKFHGSYQQDDRDRREDRRRRKLEPDYQFMIRARLPGGVLSPAQWLAFDRIAREHANGSLRITTRQTFQLHGVIKRDLKATMAAINASLIDTIAACGDVNRNVVACANPDQSAIHAEVHDWARKLSSHLKPHSRAYHEIWLDGERVNPGDEVEPLYGDTYLPRKFKIGIAVPPDNDIDVFAQDLGLVAIVDDGRLSGFNIAVGGGMGASHGDADTWPHLAQITGFVPPEELLDTAWHIVAIQRDFGDRENRKHARFKYTLADRGLGWFKSELSRRTGRAIEGPRPFRLEHSGDRYGWIRRQDGRWNLTLRIQSGRVADSAEGQILSGMRQIARAHEGELRMTCNQNVIIAGVAEDRRPLIDRLVHEHGLDGYLRDSGIRRHAIACVALPTCGLAMAESERYLPALLPKLEAMLDRHGLLREPILLRLSGCPNGCSRPYLGEIALVGRAVGRYDLRLGADFCGQRLNSVYRENIDESEILDALDALFARFAAQRDPGEHFGDFLVRQAIVAPPPGRIPLELVA